MSESLEDSSSIADEPLVTEDELKDFTEKLDQFTPVIPQTVTEYYMRKSGLQTDDERVVKLLSVSVQKFMSGIINDCYQLHKLREKSTNRPVTNTAASQPVATDSTTTTTAAAAAAAPTASATATTITTTTTSSTTDPSAVKKPVVQTNQTLTLNDLTHVLDEYGINVKKTFYYT